MISWQEHIAVIQKHVEALDTEGHLERKSACRHFHTQASAALDNLELALIREDKMKGQIDENNDAEGR